MGRAVLKDLKASTLLTFFQICKEWGLKKDEDYTYNDIKGIVKFPNGSDVFLKDLARYPADPEFDSLGSTEYTGAFIDEASQITEKAKHIVMSRLRYRLEEYDLIPKLFIASNPTKTFLYRDFYRMAKNKELPKFRKYIPALAKDNKYISKHYIANLKKTDKVTRERLLFGNWEYDDDPTRLFEYDDLIDMFTNKVDKKEPRYLSVDVARFGNDKTAFILWDGLYIKKIWMRAKQDTLVTWEEIVRTAEEFKIKRSNIIVDEDGVGGGVYDNSRKTIKGFVNNSTPIVVDTYDKDKLTINYRHLKAQCYYYLANYVHEGKIGIYPDVSEEIKNLIIEDLEQIKRKDPDRDGKLQVIDKKEIREHLGRSTDISDAMMMRMYYELNPPRETKMEFI